MTSAPASAPRRRRRLLPFALFGLVLLAAFVWFLPSLLSSGWMRGTVTSWMNRSPDHRVEFADLDLSWADGLRLEDLRVHDLRGGGGAFLTAEAVAVDVAWRPLLDRRIVAEEFTLRGIVLDMTQPSGKSEPKPEEPDSGGGTFGLESARVPMTIRDATVKFPKGTVKIEEADLVLRLEEGRLVVESLEADVNGGEVTGSAEVGIEGESPSHRLELHAKGLELDEYLAPIGARVMPLLAGDPEEGKTSGNADLDLNVTARGKRAEDLKRSLEGEGRTVLTDVSIEAKTWLTELLTAVGRGTDTIELDPVTLPFRIGDGVVTLDDADVTSDQFVAKMGGKVTLDGELDYRMRVKPKGAGATFEKYARILDREGYLPFHITGTVTDPDFGMPSAGDLLQGAIGKEIEERARGALEDLLGGRKRKREGAERPPVEAK